MVLDKQLDILSNVHRRQMLVSLAESNPQSDLTAPSLDSDAAEEERERAIAMAHVHLPKLEAHGLINWDREEHTVIKGPQFDEIRPLLRSLADHREKIPDDAQAN